MQARLIGTLLCGAALGMASPARAQDAAVTAPAAPEDAQAKIDRLEQQVQALQKSIDEMKQAMVKTTPSWKGAPQLEDKDAGWSFKPRGRLQYDVGYVSSPEGIGDPGLGFSNQLRRGRLGAEGTMPGGFGYRFEVDFTSGTEITDAFFTYTNGDLELTFGQHNNFQSLEELTSSLHSSFIERAAFTDAFGFQRAVGASAQYKTGDLLMQAGLFTDNISDLNAVGDENNSYSADGRLVFMPKLGKNQLHFGASLHRRELNDAATSVRYRQRPAIASTDVRFIDTGSIAGAQTETGMGLEAAGIFGPIYVASELFRQSVGRAGLSDPTFMGAYIDAGYFLTGETRGYKDGRFDRVKVLKPFNKGGWGSLGVNARWDYLDLTDQGIVGGTQNAFQLSLNWKPIDYVLFGLNLAHIRYDDAAISADGDRDYGVEVVGLRSQVDF